MYATPQTIAEVVQVITQMLMSKLVRLKPSISYGLPKTIEQLYQGGERLYQLIMEGMARLLSDHIRE